MKWNYVKNLLSKDFKSIKQGKKIYLNLLKKKVIQIMNMILMINLLISKIFNKIMKMKILKMQKVLLNHKMKKMYLIL